jgi:hypothetical protein
MVTVQGSIRGLAEGGGRREEGGGRRREEGGPYFLF